MLVIKFSRPMLDEDKGFNISRITTEALELRAFSAYSDEELMLNWTVFSFKNQELTLQLKFEDPLRVSENMAEIKQKDYLNINVKDKELLMYETKAGPQSFKREQLLMQTRISKQMKSDSASDFLLNSSQNLKNIMNMVVVAQTGLNFVM